MDTVYTVHLRSYGLLHPGRERMRQVLKRAWPYIPGSTLYGAIAAALIHLDNARPPGPAAGPGEFAALLELLAAQQVRFLPLIAAQQPIATAADYCRACLRPAAAPLFQAKTHAPLSREREQIHDNLLFAYGMHRPSLDYYGFVAGNAAAGALLRRGLRLLPLLPFGGKGKFALVEGAIAAAQPREAFEAALAAALRPAPPSPADGWVTLLSPLLLEQGEASWLLLHADQQIVPRLQRYRIWQSGQIVRWPEPGVAEIGYAGEQVFNVAAHEAMAAEHSALAAEFPGGRESHPATGIPEGSRFHIREAAGRAADVARLFIEGAGHAGWRSLGWGQMVMEWV